MEKQLEIKDDGTRYFMERVWIPNFWDIKKLVLDKAHRTRYFVHPGVDKMYQDLRTLYC